MNGRMLVFTGAVLLLFNAPATAGTPSDALTAEQIMQRYAAASGVTNDNMRQFSYVSVTRETSGRVTDTLVFARAPDQVFVRTSVPGRDWYSEQGFDGKEAWTFNSLGGGGVASPSITRQIIQTAALANSSELLPGRWPIQLRRMPDETHDGKSYFAVRITPERGMSTTYFIDKTTYLHAGSRDLLTDDWCTQFKEVAGHPWCSVTKVLFGDKMLAKIENQPAPAEMPAGASFALPADSGGDPADVLKHVAAALQPKGALMQRYLAGDAVVADRNNGLKVSAKWTVDVSAPTGFEYRLMRTGGKYFASSYNGQSGSNHEYSGFTHDGTFWNRIKGLIYNNCELHAEACNVDVSRLPDIDYRGATYYRLRVTAKNDPSAWYTILVDRKTYLPFAINIDGEVDFFSDYAKMPDGNILARSWDYQQAWTDIFVTSAHTTDECSVC